MGNDDKSKEKLSKCAEWGKIEVTTHRKCLNTQAKAGQSINHLRGGARAPLAANKLMNVSERYICIEPSCRKTRQIESAEKQKAAIKSVNKTKTTTAAATAATAIGKQ